MKENSKKKALVLLQLALLTAIYYGSVFIVSWLHIPVPASVAGMVILFFSLLKGWIPVRMIESGASFLTKHLAFFFVPIAVGLMSYGELIRTDGAALIGVIAGSSTLGLLVTSGLSSVLLKKGREKG